MQRFCHKLRAGRQVNAPSSFFILDTETHIERLRDGSEKHTLRLGWCCHWQRGRRKRLDKETWFFFHTAAEFWYWLTSRLEKTHRNFIIAHNLVFDFVQVGGFEMTDWLGFEQEIIYSRSGTSILGFRVDGTRVVMLDSLNYCRTSLREIGELVGIPKTTVDFATVADDDLSAYCRNDVAILLAFMRSYVGFVLDNELGKMRYTVSSQAVEAYKRNWMNLPIYIHNNEQAMDLERSAYYGGRTECFFIGRKTREKSYILDINAMYPHVMQEHPYPYRLRGVMHDLKPADIERAVEHEDCVALCDIETDEPCYPFRVKNRLCFPVGSFMAALATPEIKHALAKKHLRHVHVLAAYKRGWLFRSWVPAMMAMRDSFRKAGNQVYTQMTKLLMNSLYGKFGQRVEDWEKIEQDLGFGEGTHEEFSPAHQEYSKIMVIAGHTWVMTGEHEGAESFAAIAAHVTAHARMYLWSLIQQAGRENVYYTDTDSLIVNRAGLDRLGSRMHPTELGMLKLVDETSELWIRGAKDYIFGEGVTIKGISKTAEKLAEHIYEQQQWPGFAGLIGKGKTDEYVVKRVVKRLSRRYTKGVVGKDGQVRPLTFAGGKLVAARGGSDIWRSTDGSG